MTSRELAIRVRNMVNAAQPEDCSAPLSPIIDLGGLVVNYHSLFISALESRDDYMAGLSEDR